MTPTHVAMRGAEPIARAGREDYSRSMRAALTIAALCSLSASSALAAQKRVAILYFDNDTKDAELDLLRKGMADMLITDLSGIEGLTVVEREKLEALLGELELQRSRYFDPKTAVKLGRGAGASHAVTGAFNAVGPRLRIDVRLISVATGEVEASSKVIGDKADFFALEQRLVDAFACALTEARCDAEAPRGGPDLATVRRYAEGLDLADRGELEQASKVLQGVVAHAPRFTPAKATYRRVMKRLYAARDTRTDQRAKVREALAAKAEAALEGARIGQVGPEEAGDAPLGRWVGYRVLKGQLVLQTIDAHFRSLATSGGLDAKGRARFEALVQSYLQNQESLVRDLEAFAKNNPDAGWPDCELAEEDTKLGEELGLGDEPGVLSFYSPIQIRRDLARFLTTGAAPFWGTFRFAQDIPLYTAHRIDSGVRVRGVVEYRTVRRPPVERLPARFADAAVRHFEAALGAAEKLEDPEAKQKQIIETLDAYAHGLLALGRPMEAIARWQAILERFPKYEEYDLVEQKIRGALE